MKSNPKYLKIFWINLPKYYQLLLIGLKIIVDDTTSQ